MTAAESLLAAIAVVAALDASRSIARPCFPAWSFGDSASFQVMVGSPIITPRDGYPLYFAIADLSVTGSAGRAGARAESRVGARGRDRVRAHRAGRRRAVGIGRWPAWRRALLFAGSYTFWSQSIIAEVYALHILLVALTLWLLLRWAERSHDRSAGRVLRRLRRQLRQSPVDDAAGAGCHALPARCRRRAAGDRCSRRE